MKIGDLVKIKNAPKHPGVYIIIEIFGAGSLEQLIGLAGFPVNQVFKASQLEVICENR